MNIKIIFLAVFSFSLIASASAQIYINKKKGVKINFFSETPVENIDAENLAATSIINKDSVVFKVPNKEFIFPKALMQEHFNENYMESSKYPYSTFRGKINESVDLSKDGVYEVTANGNINIHGVEKPTLMKGTMTVKGEDVRLVSSFKVKLEDHNIKVPKVVVKNIAEDIDVKVDANYNPYKKP
jgi:polyisoprenoid-binding protein YceI